MSTALTFHPAVLACATCIGDADSASTLAANGAIFVMLGLLVLVLGSIVKFIFYLNRRAADAES